MTINIITRTNTIDEWRIETNKAGILLNNLETGDFTKTAGKFEFTNDSTLVLSSEGTSLTVANNALIGQNLSIGKSVTIGTTGSGVGNVTVGGTVYLTGPGYSANVSNNVIIHKNAVVVGNAFSENATVNANAYVGNNVTVAGTVLLTKTGVVMQAENGDVILNHADLVSANLEIANVDFIYALDATIDNLRDIATARIGIVTANDIISYNITSDNSFSDVGIIPTFTSNTLATIENLEANNATINTSALLETTITNAYVDYAEVEILVANVSSTNTATILDATITDASITDASITNASITTGGITTLSATNATILSGNVVSLTSNNALLNNSTTNAATILRATISTANISSALNVDNGLLTIGRVSSTDDALVVRNGIIRTKDSVVEGNLTVSGSFTQTGNINFEIDRFVLNANTGTNKDASVVNERVTGNDAVILWSEANERWEISTGNTWSSTYKILDGADIYDGIDSQSSTKVASANAVYTAYVQGGVVAFARANAAYQQANTPSERANSSYVHANAAFNQANSAFNKANTNATNITINGTFANAAFLKANSGNVLAQAAFDAANNAYNVGGQVAFARANAAFEVANTVYAGLAGTHVNSAFAVANTALVNSATNRLIAESGSNFANAAFDRANSSYAKANSAGNFANGAFDRANASFIRANNSLDRTTGGTITGDLVITGGLSVAGGTSINAQQLRIADNVITLNADFTTGTPSENAGFEVNRGVSNAILQWTETGSPTSSKWQFGTVGNLQNIVGQTDLNTTLGNYVLKSGSTMTGALILHDSPTVSSPGLQAATKAYVDTAVDNAGSGLPATPVDASIPGTYYYLSVTTGGAYWKQFTTSAGNYPINIGGNAATADYATDAGHADSADTATSAGSINSGGNSLSSSGFNITAGSFTVSRPATFTSTITGSTINATTFNGSFVGNLSGTASSARYADLAEKYLADAEYDEGTVLAVGGRKEVTAAKDTHFRALGVVSLRPAYLMNSDLKKGTTVALKGRVPVKVVGPVKKGEPLGLSNVPGFAKVNTEKYFAISLENKKDNEEGVVEAVIL
jgi:hypothetical protein